MPRGGPRPNSGGPRENSGRKRTASKWSDAFKRSVVRAVRRKQSETGKSPADVLIEILYADFHKPQHRVAVFKALSDALVERATHKTVDETKRVLAPMILPQMKDDPAQIDLEGKPIERPKVH